jgi:transcriptional regulator with XRE-family HTH domain
VRYLVELYADSSVNYASKVLGIPQATLQKIVTGRTKNPRASVVARVAAVCRVDAEWLLSGRGEAPSPEDPKRIAQNFAYWGWNLTLDSLGLTPSAREALFLQPLQGFTFGQMVDLLAAGKSDYGREPMHAKFNRASTKAWTELVDALIAKNGKDSVRRAIEELQAEAGVGFALAGLALLESDAPLRAKVREQLDALVSQRDAARSAARERRRAESVATSEGHPSDAEGRRT